MDLPEPLSPLLSHFCNIEVGEWEVQTTGCKTCSQMDYTTMGQCSQYLVITINEV